MQMHTKSQFIHFSHLPGWEVEANVNLDYTRFTHGSVIDLGFLKGGFWSL